ncbi:hypothetical protein L1049_005722 [Liquidambar formosana]|uniref:Uncharacterized protein n=1 Tax=Liquidambar formosana TaxID=63359 RepID=A0AAP0WS07_LIQFO
MNLSCPSTTILSKWMTWALVVLLKSKKFSKVSSPLVLATATSHLLPQVHLVSSLDLQCLENWWRRIRMPPIKTLRGLTQRTNNRWAAAAAAAAAAKMSYKRIIYEDVADIPYVCSSSKNDTLPALQESASPLFKRTGQSLWNGALSLSSSIH